MKRRALVLALLMLCPLALAESKHTPQVVRPAIPFTIGEPAPEAAPTPQVVQPGMGFSIGQPRIAPLRRYDNLVYHYGYSLPGDFVLQDEYAVLSGSEQVYEGRRWLSMDGRFMFFTQLKQPSFQSLEDEIEQLPYTLEAVRREVTQEGGRNLRYTREEVSLHRLPAGRMLENATVYELPLEEEGWFEVHQIYLDYYDRHNEYIFGLISRGVGYEDTLNLLLRIGQTIQIQPVRFR